MAVTMSSVEKIANEISRATERAMLEQLNEFVSRGLIETERWGDVRLSQSMDSDKLIVSCDVRLKLKDQKYIEELEAKIRALEERITNIRDSITEIRID